MAIDFPNSPSNNDSFSAGGKTWVYNGTKWVLLGVSLNQTVADSAITTAKIAAGAVTAAKLGNDISLTPADGSITQAKLAASLSGITATTTANRSTDVPSPFTGQTIYLSDVKRVQIWDGSAWMFVTNGAPGAPTSLSATPLSTTSVSIAFTTGTINGAAVTNYKYAYSSDSGSTYSEFAALDPLDVSSPIVISGLVGTTTYLIKLRAVSDFGDSVDSSAVSVTTLTSPSAPTSLSATGYYLSAHIAFTPGADGGSPITNYEYALSTNAGANYGAWTALSPADTTSPIDITGLANGTAYSIKLRAVNANGAGIESSAVSVTTNQNIPIEYLVIAGGGGGGETIGGGGGAGGYRSAIILNSELSGGGSNTESVLSGTVSTNYSVSVGGGGAGGSGDGYPAGVNGSNSAFASITSIGGGAGGGYNINPGSGGGSSGGIGAGSSANALSPTANQGYSGGRSLGNTNYAGGGGGAGAVGGTWAAGNTISGAGGIGIASSITGTSVVRGGGGGGGARTSGVSPGNGGLGGGGNGGKNQSGFSGTTNTGGGGGGGGYVSDLPGGAGGSGVIILRYPDTRTITIGAGLTGSTATDGADKVTTITAGSGNVSWA